MGRNKNMNSCIPYARGVGEPLTEVACACADPSARRIELLRQQRRSASLEASDRIERLDLDDDLPSEFVRQALVDELRGVEKDRVDLIYR
jgi:hypothetical protein